MLCSPAVWAICWTFSAASPHTHSLTCPYRRLPQPAWYRSAPYSAGQIPSRSVHPCHSDKRASCQAVGNIGFEQPFRHIHGLGKRLAHKMQRAAGGTPCGLPIDDSQIYLAPLFARWVIPCGAAVCPAVSAYRRSGPSIPTAGEQDASAAAEVNCPSPGIVLIKPGTPCGGQPRAAGARHSFGTETQVGVDLNPNLATCSLGQPAPR